MPTRRLAHSPRAATGSRVGWGLVGALVLAVFAVGIAGWLGGRHLGADSAVYRAGALALLRGEPLYNHAARALGTFALLEGLMFLIIPHDAAKYWTQAAADPNRVGAVHGIFDQSLNGLLSRASELAPWSLRWRSPRCWPSRRSGWGRACTPAVRTGERCW
jgi:hypothetical protein